MALSVLNHKWWPDVVLKQDKPDFLQLDLFGLRDVMPHPASERLGRDFPSVRCDAFGVLLIMLHCRP